MNHSALSPYMSERASLNSSIGTATSDLNPTSRMTSMSVILCFFFQAEDGIRDYKVTGVQTCALPISHLAADGIAVAVDDVHVLSERRKAERDRLDRLGDDGREEAGPDLGAAGDVHEIGRGAGRGRGEISVGAGSLKKKKKRREKDGRL